MDISAEMTLAVAFAIGVVAMLALLVWRFISGRGEAMVLDALKIPADSPAAGMIRDLGDILDELVEDQIRKGENLFEDWARAPKITVGNKYVAGLLGYVFDHFPDAVKATFPDLADANNVREMQELTADAIARRLGLKPRRKAAELAEGTPPLVTKGSVENVSNHGYARPIVPASGPARG